MPVSSRRTWRQRLAQRFRTARRTHGKRNNRRRDFLNLFSSLEQLEDRHLLTSYVVDSPLDTVDPADGATTLREAILDANTNAGADTIGFNIGGGGPQTISLSSALPAVTDSVTIDGSTQPGITIDANGVAGTILTVSASSSTVQGLTIANAIGEGIRLSNVSGVTVSDVDVSWTGSGNAGIGGVISGGSGNTIERVTANTRVNGLSIGSSDNTIRQVTATNASSSGAVLSGSNNTFESNDFSGSAYGVFARYNTGTGNRFLSNDFSDVTSLAIWLANDTELEVRGNDFSNAAAGLRLVNFSDVTLSPTNLEVDMGTVTGRAISFDDPTNVTVRDLELSWTGAGQRGSGVSMFGGSGNTIENVTANNRGSGVEIGTSNSTIRNVTATNTSSGAGLNGSNNTFESNDFSGATYGIFARYNTGTGNRFLSNDFSGSASQAIWLANDTELEVRGNDFSNAAAGLRLVNFSDVTLSPTHLEVDMGTVTGRAISFDDPTNVTVRDLELSWTGAGQRGSGVSMFGGSGNTIENVTANNRGSGVEIGTSNSTIRNVTATNTSSGAGLNGSNNTFESNDFSGATYAIFARYNTGTGNRFLSNDFSGSQSHAIWLATDTELEVRDNDFTNAGAGLRLVNFTDATLSPANLDVDLGTVAGYVMSFDSPTNVTVRDLDLSWKGTGQQGTGIAMGGSGNTIENVNVANRHVGISMSGSDHTIRNNDASNAGYRGIQLSTGSDTMIEQNTVTGAGWAGIYFGGNSSNNIVRQNDVSDSQAFGIYDAGSGSGNQYLFNDISGAASWALQMYSDPDFVISGNDVTDSHLGIGFFNANMAGATFTKDQAGTGLGATNNIGVGLSNVSNFTLDGLDVSWPGASHVGTGVYISGGSNNTVQHVTTGNRSNGVQVINSNDNTIDCTSILNNNTGVRVTGSTSGLVIEDSHLSGNSTAINSSPAVLAEHNYWGAADGPSNLGGSGDSYGGNVDADPFLTALPACINEAPEVPVDSDAAANAVDEGAAAGTAVGLTVAANDAEGHTLTYSLTDDAGGRFAIDSGTGIVTVADGSLLDGPDSHTVIAQASDGIETSSASFTIAVNNVAPTLTFDPVTAIDETGTAILTGTITDPGTLDTFTLDIDWGDTLSPDNVESYSFPASATGSQTLTLTHQYLDDNPSGTPQDTYTISATVTDDDAPSGLFAFTADVLFDQTQVGTGFGLPILKAGDTLTGLFEFDQSLPDNASNPSIGGYTHSNHVLKVFVNDIEFAADYSVTVNNDQSNRDSLLIRSFSDVTVNDEVPAGHDDSSLNIDFTDFSMTALADDSLPESLTLSDWQTGGLIDLRNSDSSNVWQVQFALTELSQVLEGGSATTTVLVHNVAPTFEAGANETLDPPAAGVFSRTGIPFTDPGTLDTWSGTVDFGDGGGSQPLSIDQSAKTLDLNHTYTTEGVFTVTVTLEDDDTGTHTDTFLVTVILNQPPTIDDQSFGVDENQTAVGTVAASDPDAGDTLTYTIIGGDDAAHFTINGATGALSFVGAPDFEAPADADADNTYVLQVTVTDGDGAADSAAVTVNVLNLASITGVVFVDVNQNGLYEANEAGIDGVTIELLDGSGNPVLDEGNPVTSQTSDGGFYLFEDLLPGTYQIREIQPTGVDDGAEVLGSLGGSIVANDTMELTLQRIDATDYVFAELGQQVASGDTATIGFWQNKHGQSLITQGGAGVASWLSTNFANVFGNTFSDGSDGDNGAEVAAFFKSELFKEKANKSGGPAKVDAQFMATALATYFTSSNLAGTVATSFGFNVTDTGIGTRIVNVGGNGAAFNVADNTDLTIMQLLLATNDLTDVPDELTGFAHIYDTNGDGVIDESEAALRAQANVIYAAINEDGDI